MKNRILRIAGLLAVMFSLAAMVAPSVGASPKPQGPLYVECSTTAWQQVDNSGAKLTSYGNFTVWIYALEDSRDFAYCGQVKGRVTFVFSTGCHWMDLQILENESTQLNLTRFQACSGGGGGSFGTAIVNTVGGNEYDANGYPEDYAIGGFAGYFP